MAGPVLVEGTRLELGARRFSSAVNRLLWHVPSPWRPSWSSPAYPDAVKMRMSHQPLPVDYLWGAALLVRRSFLTAIGGLDERFFFTRRSGSNDNFEGGDNNMGILIVKEGGDNFDAVLPDQFVRPPVRIPGTYCQSFHCLLSYLFRGAGDSVEKVFGNIPSYLQIFCHGSLLPAFLYKKIRRSQKILHFPG
jgi:hypothetical protein